MSEVRMQSVDVFRGLVWAALILLGLSILAGLFGPDLPEELQNHLDAYNKGALFEALDDGPLGLRITLGAFLLVYLVGYIASLVGLLGFKRWARLVFVLCTALHILMLTAAGTTLMGPLEAAIGSLESMVNGALVALLFTEPVLARFRRARADAPQPTTPADLPPGI